MHFKRVNQTIKGSAQESRIGKDQATGSRSATDTSSDLKKSDPPIKPRSNPNTSLFASLTTMPENIDNEAYQDAPENDVYVMSAMKPVTLVAYTEMSGILVYRLEQARTTLTACRSDPSSIGRSFNQTQGSPASFKNRLPPLSSSASGFHHSASLALHGAPGGLQTTSGTSQHKIPYTQYQPIDPKREYAGPYGMRIAPELTTLHIQVASQQQRYHHHRHSQQSLFGSTTQHLFPPRRKFYRNQVSPLPQTLTVKRLLVVDLT